MKDADIQIAWARALRSLRDRTGLSLASLVAKGMNRAHIRRMERGEHDPHLSTQVKIADYHNISYLTLAREIDRFLPLAEDHWHSSFCDFTALDDEILLAMMWGSLNAMTAAPVMMQVYAEALKRGASKVLINFLAVDLDLSSQDRADLGTIMADWLEEHNYRPKIAAVLLTRGITGRVMRERGFDVQTFSTQPEALEWLRQKPDNKVVLATPQERDILRSLGDLTNASPFMHWIASAQRQCLHVNQTMLEFTGMRRKDFEGDAWKRCYHPEDWAEESRNGVNYARKRPYSFSYRMRKADGSYQRVAQLATPHFIGGVFVGFLGAMIPEEET